MQEISLTRATSTSFGIWISKNQCQDYRITNLGLAGSAWKVNRVKGDRSTPILSIALDPKFGIRIQVDPKAGDKMDVFKLIDVLHENSCNNLPSETIPQNTGSILFALAISLHFRLKVDKDTFGIDSSALKLEALPQDWEQTYLDLESRHNLPSRLRIELIELMSKHGLTLSFDVPVVASETKTAETTTKAAKSAKAVKQAVTTAA
jgi:hypothetical protein